MLARKDLPNDPALSPTGNARSETSEIHDLLDPAGIDTHTLLLLYLMPEANRPDIDDDTRHAVEVLSDVQNRLSGHTPAEPFDKEKLADVIESISDIRFGCH